jgi:hypothetical protein
MLRSKVNVVPSVTTPRKRRGPMLVVPQLDCTGEAWHSSVKRSHEVAGLTGELGAAGSERSVGLNVRSPE